MKKEFVAAGFVLLSFMSPLKATAADFDKLYVFGDSLSDTGNTFSSEGQSIQQQPSPQTRPTLKDVFQ